MNQLEQAILNDLPEFNKKEYPSLKEHLLHLRIKSREDTGVGRYVYFEYSEEGVNLKMNISENICLSSEKSLELDVLEYSVNYELNITNGKIDFWELVTNGEDWDGKYEKFMLVQHEN